MKTILVSEFKTHCVGILNDVHDQGREVVVTRRGRPLARIIPVAGGSPGVREPGDSVGIVRISGEIVHTDDAGEWESLGA
jgi:prevent-host-death family protein